MFEFQDRITESVVGVVEPCHMVDANDIDVPKFAKVLWFVWACFFLSFERT